MRCVKFSTFLAVATVGSVSAFSSSSAPKSSSVRVKSADQNVVVTKNTGLSMDIIGKSALTVLTSFALLGGMGMPAHADEYGRETEAPTLFTGETTLICVKRGPLGACTKTEYRTAENDNDKADSYFRAPTSIVKQKDDEARLGEKIEGNALIEKLKKQTEDNREKNELLVQQKTFLNDQVSPRPASSCLKD